MESKLPKIIKAWTKHLEDTAIATATVKNDGAKSLVMLPSEVIDGDVLKLTPAAADVIKQNLLSAKAPDDSHDICLLLPVAMNKASKGKTEVSACVAYKIEPTLRSTLNCASTEGYFEVPLDVNDPDKTQVMLPVCLRLLDLEETVIEKCRTQEGLRNFTASLTGSDSAVTFHQVAESLIGLAVKKQKKTNCIEPRYVVLARLDLGKYEANLAKDLEGILKSGGEIASNTPAHKYLFADKDPHAVPMVDPASIWLGQGAPYSYGYGQAQVLQQIQNDSEPLVAVQGPPGTGKTALILGAIADQVCRRAYALATGQPDYDNLMLVTSDTNAAVDNVIDGLKHAVGESAEWFWLNGGNKEKTDKELSERMFAFEEWLKNTPFDSKAYEHASEKLRTLADKVLTPHKLSSANKHQLQQSITDMTSEIERLCKFEKDMGDYIKKLELDYSAAPKPPEGFEMAMAEDVLYEAGLLKRQMELLHETLNKEVCATKLMPLVREESLVVKFLSAVGIIKQKTEVASHDRSAVFELAEKETTMFRSFRDKVITTLHNFGERAPTSSMELEALVKRIESLSALYKTNRESEKLIADKLVDLDKAQKMIAEKSDAVNQAQSSLDAWVDFSEKLRIDSALVNTQHELFNASVAFLRLEALKRSSRMIQVLEQFRGDGRDRSEVVNSQEKRTLLSLAYPVLASTSLSVRNLLPAGQMGPQQGILRLCVIDESGMIPLHKVFPAIWRARKALVVGDLKQLKPVHQMSDQQIEAYHNYMSQQGFTVEEIGVWSPYESTAYHRASRCPADAGTMTGYALFLEEHRRCAQEIADTFKSIARYDMMEVCTPDRSTLGNERILRSL
ncbi:hypothetical protein FY034_18145 (plasmid) [Trichlorobacter lovleyi]|uniref:AAA domain-containing protein n=1 Tax=Trichlorobacter lovleyi TaxID=313985 RepID=UPI00224023F4|nr:AAA domain-containing protein [Trichlorobacter lovleyi]QOX80923.1 hypothetical protein FY034_18145 [Trichlorobacter lovleyi]